MKIACRDGKYYFQEGEDLFKMKGINHLTNSPGIDRLTKVDEYHEHCESEYSSQEGWFRDNVRLLRDIGFNAVGAFSRYQKCELYKSDIIYLSGNTYDNARPDSDFFSREWEDFVQNRVKEQLPGKTMVYVENEMKIGRDWRGLSVSIALGYLNMGPVCPGKKAVLGFVRHLLKGRLYLWNAATFKAFGTWQEALECVTYKRALFLEGKLVEFIMRKFYRTCRNTIKACDSSVLIGGSRLISWFTPAGAVKACSKYCDYVSVNYYWARYYLHNLLPALFGCVVPAGGLKRFYRLSGKPLYITEFGFIGENGYNNNKNPFIYKTYKNQKRRAAALARYLKSVDRDWIIGLDVFEFVDQPRNGRDMKDSEDNNFGIIGRNGKVYEEFTGVLREFFRKF